MLLECTSAECIVLLLTGNAFVAVHLKNKTVCILCTQIT